MLKNILIAVVLVVAFNTIFVFGGGLDMLRKTELQSQPERDLSYAVVDVFRVTLEQEVQKKNGTPIEGYEPQMYLAVFPGLAETDFADVEASIGWYRIVEGRLRHEADNTQLIHSAATAISHAGYKTLLINISKRIGVDLFSDGTITDVMNALISDT